MTRFIFAALAVLTLTSCGGSRVSGDVGKACMSAGRSQANPELCSCVQRAANVTLRGSDQARAAEFFADPQKAQDMRQSDNSGHEAFWLRYKAFVSTAEAICR